MTDAITVRGPVDVAELGVTLLHEHLFVDASTYVQPGAEPYRRDLLEQPVGAGNAWLLRDDPFCCVDNTILDDVDVTVEELGPFLAEGGGTVVDVSCTGMGRRVDDLVTTAQRTGLHILAGAGWYLEQAHPAELANADTDELTERLLRDITDGLDGTAVRPGIIGEIGVSPRFTPAEERCLIAAARAQASSGLPLMVHTPGWQRYGHRILDLVEAQGVDPRAVVLAHMNPSGSDPSYQRSLAARGAWLEFDMIGMGYFYADQQAQSPSADDDARAVAGLIDEGYLDHLILSHDVFLKIMWTRHGGNGYGFVQRGFLPRLHRLGVPPALDRHLLVANPRAVFELAAGGQDHRRLPTTDKEQP